MQLDHAIDPEIIVVYTMPGVASRSIFYALEVDPALSIPIYKTHLLHPKTLAAMAQMQELSVGRQKYIQKSQFLRSKLEQKLVRRNWKIITLIREPIARDISAFFQEFKQLHPKFYSGYQSGSLTTQEILEKFLEYSLSNQPDYWFEQELKPVFNIDVFTQEFSRSESFKIYERQSFSSYVFTQNHHSKTQKIKSLWQGLLTRNSVDLLLIKLENLDDCAATAVKAFLNVDDFAPYKKRPSERKAHHKLYRKFISSVALPHSYIDRMYGSRYSQHFYSEEELNKFRVKWSKSKV